MNKTQICFVNDTNPTFIIQHKQQAFCFYANAKTDKKVKYVSQAFQKMFDGKMHYFEISQQQEMNLRFDENHISINKQENGYDIRLNGKKYFYALRDGYYQPKSTVVAAPWIEKKSTTYSLAKGAVSFAY